MIAFLNEGRLDGKQILDPKVIALMSAPHVAEPGESESHAYYCYGLRSVELRGVHVIEHGGSRMGYGSEIRMFPAQRAAVIMQTNRSGATLPATMAHATELLAPLGPPPPGTNAILKVTPNDVSRIEGVYQNGSQRIEILSRDNRLFLKRDRRAEVELVKHSDSSFTAATAVFNMVAGADGRNEYIHSGSRSFARVR